MEDEVELVDIPSDSESVDDLCDSEAENDVQSLQKTKSATDCPLLLSAKEKEEEEEEEESEEEVEHVEKDGTWSRRNVPRTDFPFNKNSGPNIPAHAKTASEIFFCLFPDSLVEKIVEETNLYARQKNSKQEPVTKVELLVFLGINILMGIKKLPSYRDHWSSNAQLHDSYISSLMTVNRFGFFLSHLHLNNNNNEPKKGHPNYDKLYKLRLIIDTLSHTFKSCWNPGKYQSIDESMIKFKGRSSLKQYMPAKPIKRGYKSWTRSDESGFISEFQVYTGKSDSPEKQLGARIIKDLTRELVGGKPSCIF
ncbi:piggyBac transposable element-derived protein 4-like [Leptopilina boulardi]|uniref:piggyBac transposable element-derived protein 4-like n=1 Tax=Leptopilina boulardi TaxID=63433 RepID=UPI0021F53EDF|nr:piggyBac transposable element-derived protein 4-like [Leptopilina boulardi]